MLPSDSGAPARDRDRGVDYQSGDEEMRRIRSAIPALAVAVAAVGILAAAGTAASQLRVAIVLPGAINDHGFNQTGYDGLQRCKQEGAKVAYTEKTPVAQYVKTFQTLARSNDVVIGHGFEFGT